jgi:hypothetical protein
MVRPPEPRRTRKPKGEGRDPVVSGRVPPEVVKAMDAWAKANGKTRSVAMGLLLGAGLKRPPKVS